MSQRLSAVEAAARLGVKRETLYAYVSRGLLSRRKEDGRTSTFDPDEVASLRRTHRGRRRGGLDLTIPTRITRVEDDHLWFRDRPVADLVDSAISYEQAAELLWSGELADAPRWPVDDETLARVRRAQTILPANTPMMDRLRLTATVASATDPLRHDLRASAVAACGRRLIGLMVDGLPDIGTPRAGRIDERLWPKLTAREGPPRLRDVLGTAMVLLADHELATATVAGRVAASARADPYSVVIAGLGAVAGTLHGAANIESFDMLTAAHESGDPTAVVGEMLRQGRKIPGFGHKVYEVDPRAPLLLARVEPLATKPQWKTITTTLDVVRHHTTVAPNIDFALASFALCGALGREAGETIFSISRCAGWLAHAMEEYEETPLRFRTTARYIGNRG